MATTTDRQMKHLNLKAAKSEGGVMTTVLGPKLDPKYKAAMAALFGKNPKFKRFGDK